MKAVYLVELEVSSEAELADLRDRLSAALAPSWPTHSLARQYVLTSEDERLAALGEQ